MHHQLEPIGHCVSRGVGVLVPFSARGAAEGHAILPSLVGEDDRVVLDSSLRLQQLVGLRKAPPRGQSPRAVGDTVCLLETV